MLDPKKLEDIAKQISDAVPPGVKLSKATQHEHEAETILMKAIEDERRAVSGRHTIREKSKVNLLMNENLEALDKLPTTEMPEPKKKGEPATQAKKDD